MWYSEPKAVESSAQASKFASASLSPTDLATRTRFNEYAKTLEQTKKLLVETKQRQNEATQMEEMRQK